MPTSNIQRPSQPSYSKVSANLERSTKKSNSNFFRGLFGSRNVRTVEPTRHQYPKPASVPSRQLSEFGVSKSESSAAPYSLKSDYLDDFVNFAVSIQPKTVSAVQEDTADTTKDTKEIISNSKNNIEIEDSNNQALSEEQLEFEDQSSVAINTSEDNVTDNIVVSNQTQNSNLPETQKEVEVDSLKPEESSTASEPKINKNAKLSKSIQFSNELILSTHQYERKNGRVSTAERNAEMKAAVQQNDTDALVGLMHEFGFNSKDDVRKFKDELRSERILTKEVDAILREKYTALIADDYAEDLVKFIAEDLRKDSKESVFDKAQSHIDIYATNPEKMKEYISTKRLAHERGEKLRQIGDQLGLYRTPQSKLKVEIAEVLAQQVAESLEISGEYLIKNEL